MNKRLKRLGVNIYKRRMAGLEVNAAINYGAYHHLWRSFHVHAAGMTPKEKAYAEQLLKEMRLLHEKMQRFRDRLEHDR